MSPEMRPLPPNTRRAANTKMSKCHMLKPIARHSFDFELVNLEWNRKYGAHHLKS
jgi:hypothetical protein